MDIPNPPVALARLLGELKDPDEDVQYRAVIALGELDPPSRDAVPGLLDLVRADDPELRRSVWRTLARIGPDVSRALRDALSHALYDREHRVVESALRYMYLCGVVPAVEASSLVELLEHPDLGVRAGAARVAREYLVGDRIGACELRALRRALWDPVPVVRARVVRTLANVAPQAVTRALIHDVGARLYDRPAVATAAAQTLADLGPLAHRADPAIRDAVLRARPVVDRPADMPELPPGRWDLPTRDHAWSIVHAGLRLGGLEGPGAEELLESLRWLQQEPGWRDALYRRLVASVLAWISPRLATATPVLTGLMPDDQVRSDDAVPLAALMALIPGHAVTIARRERARQALGDEFVARVAALADAFAQPAETPAARLARALAVIERGEPVSGSPDEPDAGVLFDRWLDPFLIDVLAENGRADPEATRLLTWVAENHEVNHTREVARGALVDQLLAGERLDISHVVDAFCARQPPDPHSPELVVPRYRAALAGNILDITMTFVTGSRYCCVEWGCHLPLHDEDRWRRLRGALTAIGAAPEEPMRARITIAVECGALFFDVSRPGPAQRSRHAFAAMQASGYQHWIDEDDPHGLRTWSAAVRRPLRHPPPNRLVRAPGGNG